MAVPKNMLNEYGVFRLESFEKDFGQPYDNYQSVALLFLYILNMEQRLGFLAPKIFYGFL